MNSHSKYGHRSPRLIEQGPERAPVPAGNEERDEISQLFFAVRSSLFFVMRSSSTLLFQGH